MVDLRLTVPVARVLAVFLEDPAADRYGLELMNAADLASGTLYPILNRLKHAGWVESYWEDIDPVTAGRPARRYYRLTPTGVERAHAAMAALPRVTAPAPRPGKPALGGAGMTIPDAVANPRVAW